MMLVKIHEHGKIVTLCDSDLIGKKLEEGDMHLDITSRFYGGKEMKLEMMLNLLEDADTVNIVGKESVKFAIENNIISEGHVIYIQGVPHAQTFKL
ncbi:MAG: DUF424 family protein [Nanoarchaeota archaeon]|mgnify:CR=1 FL=1